VSRTNDIALKYVAGIRDALRKQNTAKLRGSAEVVEGEEGPDSEIADDDLAAILGEGDVEGEMGEGAEFEPSMPTDDIDQEQLGDAPSTPNFKKKRPILTKG
jgi:hypothetical protein